jgi:hypothetical protein
MKLEEYKPDILVTYLSRQTGLPDAHHERHFQAIATNSNTKFSTKGD